MRCFCDELNILPFELQGHETYLWTCAPIEGSVSLRGSESSLGTFWIAKNMKFCHVDNENSDQAAKVFSGIRIFTFPD